MATIDSNLLMPPLFEDGLNVWSSEDGTPGSATYDGTAFAALVPADQDFGSCLEILKINGTQKLRYTGDTPLAPGCYLQITARVKAVSGNLPNVRIAGWAGASGGAHVTGLTEVASSSSLDAYGEIVTVSAIVGAGAREGVELIWGTAPVFGHFGIDLTGPNGGLVRIDDIQIEDVTANYVRDLISVIDVKDYGAIGDGIADDSTAFEAADAAANGRTVLVPDGVYFLGNNVTFDSHVKFEGTVIMADATQLACNRDFNLNTYIDAFGDEVLAFKKAYQALLQFNDHASLDLQGRRIDLDGPLDMQAIVGNRDVWEIRRVIHNGLIFARPSANWDTTVVTSNAAYSTGNSYALTNVTNVANIAVGSLVEGTGVGREVYVSARNIAAQTVTLTKELHGAVGTQNYTFRRFKYMIDFGGFTKMSKMDFINVEFHCNGQASGIMMAKDGILFRLKSCVMRYPLDRGVTSAGAACQGMIFDECEFASNEAGVPAQNRTSIMFNINKNDLKVRNCRAHFFHHFGIVTGTGNLFNGNHWFQGDDEPSGTRTAGVVFTRPNNNSIVTGNYVDNNFIQWTNEHDAFPDHNNQYSFGGTTITGNIFVCSSVGSWFRWLVIKPYGADHFINGLSVTGNTFRSINGSVDRVDMLDDSFATLNNNRMLNITFTGNTFNGVTQPTINPVFLTHNQATASTNWTVDCGPYLPFEGYARIVQNYSLWDSLRNASNQVVFTTPIFNVYQGANQNMVRAVFEEPVRGKMVVTARMDNPI